MPTYLMGEAIREMRIRSGYTQEELAFGVCTPGTLSRIENGKAVVSQQVFHALTERIPGIHHVWVTCNTETEMRRSKLCKQILGFLEYRDVSGARDAHSSYCAIMEPGNPFCRQFALYSLAICKVLEYGNMEEIICLLQEALLQTRLQEEDLYSRGKKQILFTCDELLILVNLGIAYQKEKRFGQANQLMRYLKTYIEEHDLEMAETAKLYPFILYNYGWILEDQGRLMEAEETCVTGIRHCYKTGKISWLPYLLCMQARCFAASGNLETARKCRMQASVIFDMRGEICGYGSFQEFEKAREPIYATY